VGRTHEAVVKFALGGALVLALASTAGAAVFIDVPSKAVGVVNATARTDNPRNLGELRVLIDGVVALRCTTPPQTPCTFAWDTTAVANGAHRVRAQRLSTSGSITGTKTRQVTVQNLAPTTSGASTPTATGADTATSRADSASAGASAASAAVDGAARAGVSVQALS